MQNITWWSYIISVIIPTQKLSNHIVYSLRRQKCVLAFACSNEDHMFCIKNSIMDLFGNFAGCSTRRRSSSFHLCRFHDGFIFIKVRLMGPILKHSVKEINHIVKSSPTTLFLSLCIIFGKRREKISHRLLFHIYLHFSNTFQFITPSFCHLMVLFRYSLH